MTQDTSNNTILSFEHKAWGAASAILVLLIAVFAYVWTSRVAIVDVRFEKVETRFEKMDAKLDNIAISLATISAKMATKDDVIKLTDRIATNEKAIAMLNVKVEHLKKS
jgi:hypothetical protein